MGKQAVNKMRTQFLLKDVSDTATVNAGIKIVTEKLASIGIDFTFELSAFSGELKSYTSSYVDTAGQRMSFTCVHPSSFPSYQTYGTDNVCLIYDWTKVSPQPSNPVNHGKHIQLPIQFFVTFPEVFAQFFFHELCHDLVPDLTHNQGLNTEWSQKPPTDYYLYLLKTYYKNNQQSSMYSTSFTKAVNNVIEQEGGYVNNPKDPGGETNFGISKRAYPSLNIKTLTKTQAIDIYYRDYWLKIHGDSMQSWLAFNVFDFAVNAGVDKAIKIMQSAIGTVADGKIGKNTIAAMSSATTKHLEKFVHLRLQHYLSLQSFTLFGNGWIRRTVETLVRSLQS